MSITIATRLPYLFVWISLVLPGCDAVGFAAKLAAFCIGFFPTFFGALVLFWVYICLSLKFRRRPIMYETLIEMDDL